MSLTFLYQLLKKYNIVNREILKEKEKLVGNVEKFT